MTPQLCWLDLCSGLGGASQPALDRGWRVIRVDIDPRFKPDIVADVRALPLKPFHVDVLWASPPCQEFSKFGLRCFFPNPPDPDLSIAHAVKQAIERLMPRYWMVENVWSARPWFNRMFGPLTHRVPGHALWSNLGFLLPNLEPHKGGRRAFAHLKPKTKIIIGKNGQQITQKPAVACGPKRYDPTIARYLAHDGPHARSFIPHLRHAPANAAIVPYEIGEAICRAVESRTLEARA